MPSPSTASATTESRGRVGLMSGGTAKGLRALGLRPFRRLPPTRRDRHQRPSRAALVGLEEVLLIRPEGDDHALAGAEVPPRRDADTALNEGLHSRVVLSHVLEVLLARRVQRHRRAERLGLL